MMWLLTQNKERNIFHSILSRAVRYGQKKTITIFFSISILITILTQTDMLYSYKCILFEFETYFQRKPIRPFPKSCNMYLEQTYGKIHIYIYYMYMWVIKSNKITCNQSMWAKRSGSIFRSVCVRSAQSLTAKANAPLMFRSRSPVNRIPLRSRAHIKCLQ